MSFRIRDLPRQLLKGIVLIYRLGPGRLLPQVCRFRPTCSEYMLRSLEVHGAARGTWLGFKRICKCHPWHDGGLDPVPGDEENYLAKFYDKQQSDS